MIMVDHECSSYWTHVWYHIITYIYIYIFILRQMGKSKASSHDTAAEQHDILRTFKRGRKNSVCRGSALDSRRTSCRAPERSRYRRQHPLKQPRDRQEKIRIPSKTQDIATALRKKKAEDTKKSRNRPRARLLYARYHVCDTLYFVQEQSSTTDSGLHACANDAGGSATDRSRYKSVTDGRRDEIIWDFYPTKIYISSQQLKRLKAGIVRCIMRPDFALVSHAAL